MNITVCLALHDVPAATHEDRFESYVVYAVHGHSI